MDTVIDFLGILIKFLVGLVVLIIGLFIVFIAVSSWSYSTKTMASNECEVRRMDHHIAEKATSRYHDMCMASQGYRRVGSCEDPIYFAAPPFCFAPRWQFWL